MTSLLTVDQAKKLETNSPDLANQPRRIPVDAQGGYADLSRVIDDAAQSVSAFIKIVAANATAEALKAVSLTLLRQGFFSALDVELAPFRARYERLIDEIDTDDSAARTQALDSFERDLPALFAEMHKSGRLAKAMVDVLSAGANHGLAEREKSIEASSNAEYSSLPLDYVDQKTLLPSDLHTAELGKLPAEIRERAFFSAGVTESEFLYRAQVSTRELVLGTSDRATMRLALKRNLQNWNYTPEKGTEGGLRDLSSDDRLNLILDTNYAQAQGYAWDEAGQDETLLDAFPAQEFTRVEDREHPREDWPERWDAARAKVGAKGTTPSSSGQMVALKNHPIWSALSRFGTPYEPFDYNSGMGVEDVDRDTAVQLGLLGKNEQVKPEHRGLNNGLQATPQIGSDALRKALESTGIGTFDAMGVFRPMGGVS